MGYYINHLPDGRPLPATDKALALVLAGEAIKITGDKFVPNMVCVVKNGPFDAAGYCYSEAEYEAFKRPDGRPRTWLSVPNAAELSGYKGHPR